MSHCLATDGFGLVSFWSLELLIDLTSMEAVRLRNTLSRLVRSAETSQLVFAALYRRLLACSVIPDNSADSVV